MKKNTMHVTSLDALKSAYEKYVAIEENHRALKSLRSISYAPEKADDVVFVKAHYRGNVLVSAHTRRANA